MKSLQELLNKTSAMHRHLCPRQVLGVRMGLYGGSLLDIDLPQTGKRLYTIVETDGCAADGISVATNCWIGNRTYRIEDYGKLGATFIDTHTGAAFRLVPQPSVRAIAQETVPDSKNSWEAQLVGYQRIPDDQLFAVTPVRLTTPIEVIASRPGKKALCERCGEEITNQREVRLGSTVLCRACMGEAYYTILSDE